MKKLAPSSSKEIPLQTGNTRISESPASTAKLSLNSCQVRLNRPIRFGAACVSKRYAGPDNSIAKLQRLSQYLNESVNHRLLPAQRPYRIDGGRAARGEIARQGRHRYDAQRGRGHGNPVGRLDTEKLRLDQARGGPRGADANRDADRRQQEHLAHHHPNYRAGIRTQRHTDANLP